MTNNIGITKKVRLKNYYGEYLEPYVDNTDIENDIQQINNTLLQINTNFVNKNSQTDKNAVIRWGMPDYSNGITYSYTTSDVAQSYTMPADGMIAYSITSNVGINQTASLSINGQRVAYVRSRGSNYWVEDSGTALVSAGDVVTIYSFYTQGVFSQVIFYPMKGAN